MDKPTFFEKQPTANNILPDIILDNVVPMRRSITLGIGTKQPKSSVELPEDTHGLANRSRKAQMDDSDREWMLAKLEAAEARTEARLSKIEADMGSISKDVSALNATMTAFVSEIREETRAIKSSQSNLKYWIVGTGLSTGLAIVALLYAVLAYGLQNFEAAIATIGTIISAGSTK